MKFYDAEPLYVTRYGSHAFGLATPESDLDLRGIFVAPLDHYLGFQPRVEHVQNDDREIEIFYFEITKFFRLAADANPSVLEILFTDEGCPLPARPDRSMLDRACLEIVAEALGIGPLEIECPDPQSS